MFQLGPITVTPELLTSVLLAIASAITALVQRAGRQREAEALRATIQGVENGSRTLAEVGSNSVVVKHAIKVAAERLGVQDLLHARVKAITTAQPTDRPAEPLPPAGEPQ